MRSLKTILNASLILASTILTTRNNVFAATDIVNHNIDVLNQDPLTNNALVDYHWMQQFT